MMERRPLGGAAASGEFVGSFSYWTFCDVFEEVGMPASLFRGGFGLLAYRQIKKPTYHLYAFITRMGDQVLACGDDHLLTRDATGRVTRARLDAGGRGRRLRLVPRERAEDAHRHRGYTVGLSGLARVDAGRADRGPGDIRPVRVPRPEPEHLAPLWREVADVLYSSGVFAHDERGCPTSCTEGARLEPARPGLVGEVAATAWPGRVERRFRCSA
jgi:hypothetical protein